MDLSPVVVLFIFINACCASETLMLFSITGAHRGKSIIEAFSLNDTLREAA